MRLGWIPDADTSSGSKVRFGLRRTSDGQHWESVSGDLRPKGVLYEETWCINSALWGQEVQLWVKQEAWYAKLVYFCVDAT